MKVGDFGLVTMQKEHVTEDNNDTLGDEDSGTKSNIGGDEDSGTTPHRHTDRVGTRMYWSPEQVSGQ